MTRNVNAICVLSFALATFASAQTTISPAGGGTHYTPVQLKKLAQEAHTPSQYSALAEDYRTQQDHYLAQAADAKREWARRSNNVVSTAAKYPRPADSARQLYEYYTYKAVQAEQLEAKFDQLSNSETTVAAK